MLSKKRHVLKVTTGKTTDIGKGIAKIAGQTLNDFGPPTLHLLTLADFAAEAVIQLHQLGIGGQRRTLPGLGNIAFELR
jgi:hypothetical protein